MVNIVNSKNKFTLSSTGKRGFLGETPKQKHLAGAKYISNFKIYYSCQLSVINGIHAVWHEPGFVSQTFQLLVNAVWKLTNLQCFHCLLEN